MASEPRERPENTRRMVKCPKEPRCEAPKCPLDELYEYRISSAEDRKCTMKKEIRYSLGKDMEHCGLSPKEWCSYLKHHKTEEAVRKRLEEDFG